MSKFRNVNIISVQEWDALVTEVYGKPYSFQQQDGCKEREGFLGKNVQVRIMITNKIPYQLK